MSILPNDLLQALKELMLQQGIMEQDALKYLVDVTPAEAIVLQDIIREFQQYGCSNTYTELRGIQWKREPVDPETFLMDDYYLGAMGRALYPELQKHFINIYTLNNFIEIILTGGIGYGKDYFSVILGCYEFYKLSCLKNPHMYLGLAPNTPIVGAILNVTTSKSSEYFDNFKAAIDEIEYFKENFPRNPRKGSVLEFPSRVTFKDAGSTTLGALGSNNFFSCFTGDTSISLVNGTERTFAELYEEKLKDFWVYTCSKEGHVDIAKTKGTVFISKYVSELVEVTLDNGRIVKCTPEHMWQLRDGEYKQASGLLQGESLMPLYLKNNITKVTKVCRILLKEPVPVYDIEVDHPNHNFSLTAGVFVHNCLNETNFMQRITGSKKQAPGKTEYNQALSLYTQISKRLKSRFLLGGVALGKIVLISSKRYPNDFLEEHIKIARNDPYAYVIDYPSWGPLPKEKIGNKFFFVEVGDLTKRARIILPYEEPEYIEKYEKEQATITHREQSTIIKVPEAYRSDFVRDIDEALRDSAGISTMTLSPFFANRSKLATAFGMVVNPSYTKEQTEQYNSQEALKVMPVNKFETNLFDGFKIYYDRLKDKDKPRFIHIDLARNRSVGSCKAGLSCGYFGGWKTINTIKGDEEMTEQVPLVNLDFNLNITASPYLDEIDFGAIRSKIIYAMAAHGIKIEYVTNDGFDSFEFQQILNKKGIKTDQVSVDKTDEPYTVLKHCVYQDRLTSPYHPVAVKELIELERDNKTGKINHPVTGTKDIADSIAGVSSKIIEVYGSYQLDNTYSVYTDTEEDSIADFLASKNKLTDAEFMSSEVHDGEDYSALDVFTKAVAGIPNKGGDFDEY